MTEFERITESTETLAAFLASLPCIEGPWNEAFHERFCNYCPAKDCDNCQYEEYRNNPLAQAATAHVFYHRTYCNHMNAWIARADLEELPAIVYGAELPKDLAASMAAIIAAAGGGAA